MVEKSNEEPRDIANAANSITDGGMGRDNLKALAQGQVSQMTHRGYRQY